MGKFVTMSLSFYMEDILGLLQAVGKEGLCSAIHMSGLTFSFSSSSSSPSSSSLSSSSSPTASLA